MAKAVCSTPELLRSEQHLREVLTKCKYTALTLNRMEYKNFQQNNTNNNKSIIKNTNNINNNTELSTNPIATLLYHMCRACVKVLRISLVSMASKYISKATDTQETPGTTKRLIPNTTKKWYNILE